MQAYFEQKMRGYDVRAMEDLKNVAHAEEAYFASFEAFTSCTDTGCISSLPGIKALSDGVTLQITATSTGFVGTATNRKGSGVVYTWDNNAGGLAPH